MGTEFGISLFCADEKLSASLSESLAAMGAPEPTRAQSFGSLIEHVEATNHQVVALLSLADLCQEGLDAIALVDMQLSMLDDIDTVLLVEPWVAGELDSVMLMTGFDESVPSGDATALAKVIEKLVPGAGLEPPPPPSSKSSASRSTAPPPPSSSHAVRDVVQTRSVVRDIHGLTGGRLDDVWLPRILYSLYARKFTGELSLVTPQRELTVQFVDGVAGDEETGDRRKLLSAFAWTTGRFSVAEGHASRSSFRTYGSMLELIYDGCVEFVSINQTAERLAGYDDYFPVCTEFLEARSELLSRRETLQKFCLSCDGTRTWSAVISATWRDVREVLKAAIFALETDLIVMRPQQQKDRARVRYTTRSTAGIQRPEASASRNSASAEDEEKIVSRLTTRLEHFDRMDAYSLFGLQPGCGLKAVRTQFYKMVKQHHPDVYGGNTSPDIQGMAELVFIHIKDAYVELVNLERDTQEVHDSGPVNPSERVVSKIRSKDASSRTAAKAREAAGGSASPPSRPSRATRSRPVVSSRSRPSRAVKPPPAAPSSSGRKSRPTAETRERPVPPPPSREPSIRKTRQRPIPKPVKAENVTQEGTPAVVFEPPPGPARRARPLRGKTGRSGKTIQAPALRPAGRREDGPAVGATASRVPKRKQTGEQRERMSTKLPPEKHFKNGNRFLAGKAFEKAKEAFRHAVTGDEANPVYRAHYAYARYCAEPTDFTKCLQMLQDCLELDGRTVEAHLFMGRIAKQEGQTNRAIKSFRAALAEDARNIEAAREIRLYEMRGGKKEEPKPKARPPGKGGKGAKAGDKGDGNFFGKLFNRKKDS